MRICYHNKILQSTASTFIVRPPCIVSMYSSPSLNVFDELDMREEVFIVHNPSTDDISIVGEEEVIIFRGTHGIPIRKKSVGKILK